MYIRTQSRAVILRALHTTLPRHHVYTYITLATFGYLRMGVGDVVKMVNLLEAGVLIGDVPMMRGEVRRDVLKYEIYLNWGEVMCLIKGDVPSPGNFRGGRAEAKRGKVRQSEAKRGEIAFTFWVIFRSFRTSCAYQVAAVD